MKSFYFFTFFSLLSIFYGCNGDQQTDNPKTKPTKPPVKILQPKNDAQYTIGDDVMLTISVEDAEGIKNLSLYVDDSLFKANLTVENQTIAIPTLYGKVGYIDVYLTYDDKNGDKKRDTRRLVFFSDIKPKNKTALIVNTYPHEKASYTQGLEFYNNQLFEGTGQYGQSVLTEVDLKTGKRIRQHELEKRYFGEGITIINDTIYQITWSEKTCFVYDMNFNEINRFSYTGEGWGLCNNGNSIIMTNGSSEIVWRNRHTFEIEKRIYTFSDQYEIGQLNEMELINGSLFINVYTENRIIEVDTTSGKVLSSIDCTDIVKDGRIAGADVLNGIAYNKQTGKIYITGKLWPKLYEVLFEEQLP